MSPCLEGCGRRMSGGGAVGTTTSGLLIRKRRGSKTSSLHLVVAMHPRCRSSLTPVATHSRDRPPQLALAPTRLQWWWCRGHPRAMKVAWGKGGGRVLFYQNSWLWTQWNNCSSKHVPERSFLCSRTLFCLWNRKAPKTRLWVSIRFLLRVWSQSRQLPPGSKSQAKVELGLIWDFMMRLQDETTWDQSHLAAPLCKNPGISMYLHRCMYHLGPM